MKLKRLILQGFKSFKDKTLIHFDEGITGIVGPNGCGKSNIVDALFWVMGEQSAKHLRGNSMKDVIFSGSAKYNGAPWAEVSLILENDTGKHIHIGDKVTRPNEIQLTRKLYRNGETEYRINNLPARLKDIQEVFMDTGAGAKSYSIIAQGEIDRLVKAKPEERRTMIEEVAGITKFKMRRKESSKKIEQTEANLKRLEDLEKEIEKNLKNLEKQVEKAQEAKNLKSRIRRYELIVESHQEFGYLTDIRDLKKNILEKRQKLQEWANQKNLDENELEKLETQRTEQEEVLEDKQSSFNEDSKKLATQEERLRFSVQSQKEKRNLITQRTKENEDLQKDLEERLKRLDLLGLELGQVQEEGDQTDNLEEKEERVQELKHTLEDKDEDFQILKKQVGDIQSSLSKKQQEVVLNKSKLDEYSRNLQDMAQEIEALEKHFSLFSSQIQKERDEVENARIRQESAESELAQNEDALKSNQKLLKEQEQKLHGVRSEQMKLDSKLSSLKELNATLPTTNKATQEVFRELSGKNVALLGNLVTCSQIYTGAVQAQLKEVLDALITDPGTSAKELLGSLKTFPDLLMVSPADLPSWGDKAVVTALIEAGLSSVRPLMEVLNVTDPTYTAQIEKLTSGHYIVEGPTFESFLNIPEGLPFATLSTPAGDVLIRRVGEVNIFTSRNSAENAQGIVHRNNQIADLTQKLEVALEELNTLTTQVETLRSENEERVRSLEESKRNFYELKAQYGAKKATLDSKVSGMDMNGKRLEILKKRNDEVSGLRFTLIENDEDLGAQISQFEEEYSNKKILLESLEEEIGLLRENYDDERESLVEIQVKSKSRNSRLKSLESQLDDVKGQIEKYTKRLESNTSVISEGEVEVKALEEALVGLRESTGQLSTSLSEKQEELSELKGVLSDITMQIDDLEDNVQDLNSQINKVEKALVEMDLKVAQAIEDEEQVTRNILEKYRLDLRATLGAYLEYAPSDYEVLKPIESISGNIIIDENVEAPEEFSFSRRYGKDLKECEDKLKSSRQEFQRLGDINWQAVHEYDSQKIRHDFLKSQEAELKASLEDLLKAIVQIDEKCKKRFQEAFAEVDERFRKVFPIIFGGGLANLRMIGDIQTEEFGIDIVAQPPGKKMQNINLMSGGEKAMTAVSLIFSIFLVKPSPFCLLDEVDAPLDDANVGRFNDLLREMSGESQFILITHNKKTMEMNDALYGVTMQEPGISKAVSIQLQ